MQIKQSVCGVLLFLSSPLKSTNSCRRTESGGVGVAGAVPWCGGRWGETKDMIPVSVETQVVQACLLQHNRDLVRFYHKPSRKLQQTNKEIPRRGIGGEAHHNNFRSSGKLCHLVKKAFKKH